MKDGPESPLEVSKLLLCSKRARVSIAIYFLGKAMMLLQWGVLSESAGLLRVIKSNKN